MMVVMARHIDFAAYDGLDVGEFLGSAEELLDAVHIPVVSNGKSRHPEGRSLFEELRNVGKAVENGILGVDVKVYERHDLEHQFGYNWEMIGNKGVVLVFLGDDLELLAT